MSAPQDITGLRFGRLVAICRAPKINGITPAWLFRCDCGNEKILILGHVRRGNIRSCNCGILRRTHGKTRQRIHTVWGCMKQRCANPKNDSFPRYGGRGIGYCSEWESFEVFQAWAMANGYGDNLELDRIDNDGNYEPSNCRFVTRQKNMSNRSCTKIYDFGGILMTPEEAGRVFGMPSTTIRHRIKRGATPEEAVRERTLTLVEYDGRSMSIADLAERFGLKPETLRSRLKRGWPVERALQA